MSVCTSDRTAESFQGPYPSGPTSGSFRGTPDTGSIVFVKNSFVFLLSVFDEQHDSLKLGGEHLAEPFLGEPAYPRRAQSADAERVDPHIFKQKPCVRLAYAVFLADQPDAGLRRGAERAEDVVKRDGVPVFLHEPHLVIACTASVV